MASHVIQPGHLPRTKFGKVNRWVWIGGVVVVVGAGALAYSHFSKPKVTIPADDLYTVGYGSVVQTISAAGTIQPLQQINLNFSGASGTINTIAVGIGQQVKKGQILATLSDATIGPEIQAAQASVAAAQANMATLEQGPTAATIATDEASVQHAELVLAGAQRQYQDLLTNVKASTNQSLTTEENQVTQDKMAVTAAEASVSSAQVKLQQAQASISSEQQALTAAQSQLTSDKALLTTDQAVLANAQQTLTADQATLSQDQTLYGTLASQYQTDEQAYQNALLDYNSWSGYGNNPYSTEVSTTGQAATQAENAYNTIQNAKNTVQSDQTAILSDEQKIQADQSTIQSAEANIQSAEADLAVANQTSASSSSSTDNILSVQAAQTSLQQAEISLQSAQSAYQGALNTLAADENVTQSSNQTSIDQAKSTIALDENAVTSAKDQLVQAETPPTAAQLAQDQAAIQSAQAQLASTKATQSDTVLTAPISGVIVASNYQPGDSVTVSTPVFVLDNTIKSDLEVNVDVAEADIGQIKPGEPVTVTASAYPNAVFHGAVMQVEPNPQVVNSVTEYTVLTSVNNPTGQLLPGMTTNVSIQTAKASHVLTIPAVALQTVGSTEGVYVHFSNASAIRKVFLAKHKHFKPKADVSKSRSFAASSGGVVFVPVKIGVFGTSSVQVERGVFSGEQILLVSPTSINVKSSSFRGGLLGGRLHGGGGFHGRRGGDSHGSGGGGGV